jgi:hypothetical protein
MISEVAQRMTPHSLMGDIDSSSGLPVKLLGGVFPGIRSTIKNNDGHGTLGLTLQESSCCHVAGTDRQVAFHEDSRTVVETWM